jgi:hypothetical protein
MMAIKNGKFLWRGLVKCGLSIHDKNNDYGGSKRGAADQGGPSGLTNEF